MRDRIVSVRLEILWHAWEMVPLDHGLQSYIRRDQNYRKWQRTRADWYESRDYWLNIENLQWELDGCSARNPFINAYFGSTIRFLKEQLYK